MNEEPRKKYEKETAEGKLQPWTLHDYTIKSYVQDSKRQRKKKTVARGLRRGKRERAA